MANIATVDYMALPGKAKEIRACGNQLNMEVQKAYQTITTMHNSWYGIRYNELATKFNDLIPVLDNMLRLVVTEIPTALETVASNYAKVDGVGGIGVSTEAHKKIANIEIHNDVGMRFVTSDVTEMQNNVSNYFTNAIDSMNKCEATYKTIVWQSEASEAFKVKFTSLKGKIVASFDNLKAQFTKLMQETKDEIERAEKSNTVN